MAGNVKGITVEIGGDTSPLNKALAEINKSGRGLQNELKKIDGLLKLDPSNVDLLRQKQEVLNQAMTNGKEKLEVLKAAQTQANEAIANGADISAEQMRDLERQIIACENSLQNLSTQAEDVEKNLSGAADSSEDAEKKIEDLGDSVKESSEKADDANEKFEKLKSVLGGVGKAIGTAVLAIGTAAAAAGKALFDMAKASAEASGNKNFINAQEAATKALDNFKNKIAADVLPGLSDLMRGFAGIVSGQKDAEQIIQKGIDNLLNGLEKTLPKITALVTRILDTITAVLPSVMGSLIEAVLRLLPDLLDTILQTVSALIPVLISAIFDLIGALVNSLPLLVEVGIKIVTGLIQGLGEAYPTLLKTLPELIKKLADVLINSIPIIITAVLDTVNAIFAALVESLPLLIEAGVEMLLGLIEGINKALPELLKTLPEIIKNVITVLVEAIPALITATIEIITAITKFVIENLPLFIELAIEIIFAIIAGLTEAIPDLIMAIPKIIEAIIEAFTSIDWGEVGINILKGIGDGLVKGVTEIWDSIKKAAGSLEKKFKEFFGIKSPSALFRDEIGKNLMLGIGVGFDENSVSTFNKMKKNLQVGVSGILTSNESAINNFNQILPDTSLQKQGGIVNNNYNISVDIHDFDDLNKLAEIAQSGRRNIRMGYVGGA